jgi:hypothetical protein
LEPRIRFWQLGCFLLFDDPPLTAPYSRTQDKVTIQGIDFIPLDYFIQQ